jgi:hypothetical protein
VQPAVREHLLSWLGSVLDTAAATQPSSEDGRAPAVSEEQLANCCVQGAAAMGTTLQGRWQPIVNLGQL